MRTIKAVLVLSVLGTSCGVSRIAAGQQMPARRAFMAPSQPVFFHHEGRTALGVAGTVGGTLLASYVLYAAGADSSWEKAGAMTFTLPFAFVGTIAGAFVGDPEANFIAGPMVGGIIGGLIGGGVGKQAGVKAARGSRGSRGAVRVMMVMSVPAALGIFAFFWGVGGEY